MILLFGTAGLALCAAAGTYQLLGQERRRPIVWLAAGLSLLPFGFMPLGFLAGLALAPWALMAFWTAPFFGSVALLALLAGTLSPALTLGVLVLGHLDGPGLRPWADRVLFAAALAAPAWLPLLLRSSVVLETGRAWPVAPPSEWLAAVAWGAAVAGARSARFSGRLLMLSFLGLIASIGIMLKMAPPLPKPVDPATIPRYNQEFSRYIDDAGERGLLTIASRTVGPKADLVGSLDGIGSLASIRRWQQLAYMGVRDPDLLSLANVGWVGSGPYGGGVRWQSPVAAALVDTALTVGDNESIWAGHGLFERPLRVQAKIPEGPKATGWQILTPEVKAPGEISLSLPKGHRGGWLFLSQSFDPGWEAIVMEAPGTAKPMGVVPTEGEFLALPVESGAISVAFEYEPPLNRIGLILCALSFAYLAWKERGFLFQAR